MKVFITENKTAGGETWEGPEVYAKSWEDAEQIIEMINPSCKVVGVLKSETETERKLNLN